MYLPDIGVHVRLANGKTETPERNVIGDIGSPDRSKEDGVVFLQDLDIVVGDISARLLVAVRGPVEVGKLVFGVAQLFGDCVDDLDSGINHFGTNSVGSDLSDLVEILSLGWNKGYRSVSALRQRRASIKVSLRGAA
jgi:hypothetical protein